MSAALHRHIWAAMIWHIVSAPRLEIGPDAVLCCGRLDRCGIVKGCRILEDVLKEVPVMGFQSQAGLLGSIDVIQCFKPQLIREPACGNTASTNKACVLNVLTATHVSLFSCKCVSCNTPETALRAVPIYLTMEPSCITCVALVQCRSQQILALNHS